MDIAMVLCIYACILLFDFMPIIKKKKKTEILSYLVLMSLSFTLLMLNTLNFKVPSPSDAITFAVGKLFRLD